MSPFLHPYIREPGSSSSLQHSRLALGITPELNAKAAKTLRKEGSLEFRPPRGTLRDTVDDINPALAIIRNIP